MQVNGLEGRIKQGLAWENVLGSMQIACKLLRKGYDVCVLTAQSRSCHSLENIYLMSTATSYG